MTEPLTIANQRALLSDLCRLVAQRTPADAEIPARRAEEDAVIEKKFAKLRDDSRQRYTTQRSAAEATAETARRRILQQYETDHQRTQHEFDAVRKAAFSQFEAAETVAKSRLQEARWEATTIFEATKDGPDLQLREVTGQVGSRWQEIQSYERHAAEVLRRRWQPRDQSELDPVDAPPPEDAMRRFGELAGQAKKEARALVDQTASRLIEGGRPLGILLLAWLAAVYPCGAVAGWSNWYWIAASAAIGAIVAAVAVVALYRTARRQSSETYRTLRQTVAEADAARAVVLDAAKATCQRQREAIAERLAGDLKKADEGFTATMTQLRLRKQSELEEADRKYPALLEGITARRDCSMAETDAAARDELGGIDQAHRTETRRIEQEYSAEKKACEERFWNQWNAMAGPWHHGMEQFRGAIAGMNATCDRLFPDWSAFDPAAWQPPTENPPAVRFGQYDVRLAQIEGGVPADERLQVPETEFRMPAILPFPEHSLLLLKADGQGQAAAIEAFQAIMLRLLTSTIPAKVRFTIIDPVGLGENFSAFMHLADYDEKLVSSRIWTESTHIEQRLADLTQHMETVIQVYLRNEFESIQQYNATAGELAEPYRVLVVANFPAGFSENAAKRLRSIVASGARCGVYTLLSTSSRARMPRDFRMSDIESRAMELTYNEDRLQWQHPEFGPLPLELDRLPPPDQFTEIVRRVGQEVQDAGRVEVPFDCVVPEQDQWWTGDSRAGLEIPLGRAGAKKLQSLELGKGTSQHLLVSGKTGSGKSTLWHALITNAAVRYSPDELQLYLVDFKKGVEFKAYATAELPHARVIAIESEREFGLSVLERLDAELRERGDMFRKLGVQDIRGFRDARPDAVLPRLLLVIDEFQELFVDDDRIAQSAALLLDRLVRQGRAFGIHALLGSQTLAGAYSLPRSTIGQMAVRIALQCSEADAHLILSEENTAARLLTRPGEAIYNDANGLYEGNHPFQVVWLPDDQRETYLERIGQLAANRHYSGAPAIVFEGNSPADPSGNACLASLLAADSWPDATQVPRAWLGEAVAIKEPTSVELARHSGANLLMVGHREDLALGIMATGLVSLAAHTPPGAAPDASDGPRFFLLDGARPDAPEAGFWPRLAGALPHSVRIASPRELAAVVNEVAEEVERRRQADEEDAPPIYLCIYNLGRFRDLRRKEDDFGFSRMDEDQPASPSQQFATILREGPSLGVHAIVWSDTLNNVNNTLDRQGIREMEMRVLFQMNATDSSNLIDSTAAAGLGVHRAVLYHEGVGQLEKFRPYRLPSERWLAWAGQQLGNRPAGQQADVGGPAQPT